jgi:phosphoribosylamine--glycine ligase
MLTRNGPYVIEFNCRFGDPETEAIVTVEGRALGPLLHAVAVGDRLPEQPTAHPTGYAVTTILAAAGYPEHPRAGDAITLPDTGPGSHVHVFHAGTARSRNGTLLTAGGRVLAVTAVQPTLDLARRASLQYATAVTFAGKQFRTDIGARANG